MELSCDRCLARFSTSVEPVPGRTYRVPCVCGNTLVVELDASGGGARLLASAELELARSTTEDPFARDLPRRNGRVEVTTRLHEGKLAERDPDAVSEESAEYRVTGAVSFDDLLRRARAHGFLVGAAAGAIGAAVVAVALALATARPAGTTTVPAHAPLATPATAAAPPAGPIREPPSAAPRGPTRRRAGAEVGSAPAAPSERPARPERRPAAAAVTAEVLPVPADASEGVARGTTAAAAPEPAPAAAAAPAQKAGAPTADEGPATYSPALEGAGVQSRAHEERGATAGPASRAIEPSAASRPRRPFPEEDVAAALRSRRAAVSECVAATPGDPSAARGRRFSLTVVIDPRGRVAEVSIDDPEVQETPLGVCLLRLARTMSFAPFEGEPYRVELALDYGDAG